MNVFTCSPESRLLCKIRLRQEIEEHVYMCCCNLVTKICIYTQQVSNHISSLQCFWKIWHGFNVIYLFFFLGWWHSVIAHSQFFHYSVNVFKDFTDLFRLIEAASFITYICSFDLSIKHQYKLEAFISLIRGFVMLMQQNLKCCISELRP